LRIVSIRRIRVFGSLGKLAVDENLTSGIPQVYDRDMWPPVERTHVKFVELIKWNFGRIKQCAPTRLALTVLYHQHLLPVIIRPLTEIIRVLEFRKAYRVYLMLVCKIPESQ
jgi:hypothetical protein